MTSVEFMSLLGVVGTDQREVASVQETAEFIQAHPEAVSFIFHHEGRDFSEEIPYMTLYRSNHGFCLVYIDPESTGYSMWLSLAGPPSDGLDEEVEIEDEGDLFIFRRSNFLTWEDAARVLAEYSVAEALPQSISWDGM